VSVLRDLSLILLALEWAVFTLVVLAALAAINYGLFRLRWWHTLPRQFALARGYLDAARRVLERMCRAAAAPIFAVGAARAALSGAVRGTGYRRTDVDARPRPAQSESDLRRPE